MERQEKRYSNQQANTAFQPQNYRQSGFEQVNPGRTEIHSSSDHGNGNKTRDSIHKVQAGDTLWNIAEDKLGSGSRWTELQKKDRKVFTNQEAHHLQIGTEIYLPNVELANGSPYIPKLQQQIADLKTNPSAMDLEAVKGGDHAINPSSTNSSSFAQLKTISFSGADLIKATHAYPESVSFHQLKSAKPANFSESNISPATFYETAEGAPPQFQEGVYLSLGDTSSLAQGDTQFNDSSDNQHLFGFSENEYIAQHILSDAAAGYLTGDLTKKLADKVNGTPSQTGGEKSKGFVSVDAEELGRRITKDRQKMGGQQHPFERLGKYDAATGKFTLNPRLGVDEVTIHETRPVVWRPKVG